MTAKSNRARCGRCARRKFQKRWRILTPICCRVSCAQPNDLGRISGGASGDYSAGSANPQRSLALLVADGLVKGENNELLAQACNEDGWPIFVVPNLHRHDRARRQCIDVRLESARSPFNIAEAADDFAVRVENRSTITVVGERPLPRSQQLIVRFHRLQEPSCADTFRAPCRR